MTRTACGSCACSTSRRGKQHLGDLGRGRPDNRKARLLGISCICNLLAAIKTARYFELGEQDVIFTVFTDSADLYRSRLRKCARNAGAYRDRRCVAGPRRAAAHQRMDYFKELGYYDRKAIHNLKYYTWVEQQGKTSEELNAQWDPEYWSGLFEHEPRLLDELIDAFNREVGLPV